MAFAPVAPLTGEHGQALSKLLMTGTYSDLTITCGKDKYAVHKAIVCSRSPLFAAACDGELKETKTGAINLPNDDPIAVKMMIRYLYTQNYVPPETSDASESKTNSTQKFEPEHVSVKRQCVSQASPSGLFSAPASTAPPRPVPSQPRAQVSGVRRDSHWGSSSGPPKNPFAPTPAAPASDPPAPPRPPNLVLHAKVYQLGEKYGMKDLMALSLYKFRDETVAHHHSDSFRHASRFVYGSTVTQDRGMRNAVVQAVKTNIDLLDDKAFQVVIKGTELGFDLLLSLTQTRRGELKREAASL
ncbi:hypothetical protein FAUST_8159 [Fusarium austroamericanum]|uniref:BTB domain-containing protein n=1 Tax=Fusarium austroamericanum TaxID=282268 RepID=A0AAN5Z5F4_FUSAU|nr:hypothetical protein FAUST_8159 [Fusarium austroamericanum]